MQAHMLHPYNRILNMPSAGYDVRHLQARAGNPRLVIARRGMRASDESDESNDGPPLGVPMWGWTLGGGLVAGLLVGAMVYKKKR